MAPLLKILLRKDPAVSRTKRDPEKLRAAHRLGTQDTRNRIEAIRAFVRGID